MKHSDPSTKRLPPQLEESLKKDAEVTAARSKSHINVPVPTRRRHLSEAEETELSFLRAKYATRCVKGGVGVGYRSFHHVVLKSNHQLDRQCGRVTNLTPPGVTTLAGRMAKTFT
jgi:hypothetical protein